MADRGPNPDLWMVTAGPCQPLEGILYPDVFIPKSCALGLTSKALTPR